MLNFIIWRLNRKLLHKIRRNILMKKLIFTSFIVLSATFFFSCATLDSFTSKVSSATKSVSKGYVTPESYDEAYSYRTDTPYKSIQLLLKDKNLESLRTGKPSEYVKKACESISSMAKNDFEKVKMAHDFVAILVSYDAANFWAGTVPDQEYTTVIKTKTAVCEGYANTFKKFCDTLGITCQKISGYARGVGTSLLNEPKPTNSNHAWNLVKINEAWYIVDCTWDSGHMEGKISKQDYNTDWLFLKPEHCIYTHYPSNSKHQLLPQIISATEFSELPDLRPKFFNATENATSFNKLNKADGIYLFSYNAQKNYELSFQLINADTNSQIENASFIKKNDDKNEALFSFPKAGTYSIRMFYRKNSDKMGHSCGEFLVNSSSASSIEYPTTYSSSAKNLEIISPIEMPLKKGQTYRFSVKVENKKFVAVICGKDFIQLENDGNGLFSGEVTIPSNVKEVKLSVANSQKGSYEGIATYTVK